MKKILLILGLGFISTLLFAKASPDFLKKNGQLHVCGLHLCNEQEVVVQLKGMSSHGIQWYGWAGNRRCLTPESLDVLVDEFKATVIRVSLYVQEGGYETNPEKFTQEVNTIIAEASQRGLYVIVDWHILEPGDPNYNLERAKTFFHNIAISNQGRSNLLYEIANEPNKVHWNQIKSYADELIPWIRLYDSHTPILVGTPAWSSLGVSERDEGDTDDIIANPVNATNIMYTFHFYAGEHDSEYLNELKYASGRLPIFVTEWGTQKASGGDENNFIMAQKYIDFMNINHISWVNWNYSDDHLSGAVWKVGTCPNGPWTDEQLKPAGVWVKSKLDMP